MYDRFRWVTEVLKVSHWQRRAKGDRGPSCGVPTPHHDKSNVCGVRGMHTHAMKFAIRGSTGTHT